MTKLKIFGVEINDASINEVKSEINLFLSSGQPHLITTVNPEILLKAKKDPGYKRILNSSKLSLADGVGIIYASSYLNKKIKNRMTGSKLIELLAEVAAKKRKSLFLLGARNDIADKAGKKLSKKYPNLKIAGTSNGTVSGRDLSSQEIINQINSVKPDILLVAFGAPKQEKWLYKNLIYFTSVRIGVGVGGAFDFLAGKVTRAPRYLRKMGLEWLWRLIRQPWRIFRIFNAVIRFSFMVIKNKKYE